MLNVSQIDLNDADDEEGKDVNVMILMMMMKIVISTIVLYCSYDCHDGIGNSDLEHDHYT